MREYSIREFRMKLKEAFEAAESGDVYITRKGQRYRLSVESVSQQLDRLADEHAAAERELYGTPNNTPTPEIPETPKPTGQQRVAEQQRPAEIVARPGLPCCMKPSPCKHWRWDPQLAMWQNILTGEIREAQ
nr:MAG TPA: antitoxin [Caudoviricetes sp.]